MRLQTVLAVAVVSLLVSTVALVAGSQHVYWTRSASELAEGVLAQAAGRIDRAVRNELEVTSSVGTLLRSQIEHGLVRSDDLEGLGRFQIDLLRAHPSLSYISFGVEATGEMAQASRFSDGSLRERFLRRRGDDLHLDESLVAPTGLAPLWREEHKSGNSPRLRPYYAQAKATKRPIWTETYPFFGEKSVLGAPGLTRATPVLTPDGSLLGVITCDFDLLAVSRFLKRLAVLQNGSAFIVEYRRDGQRVVIAHPTAEMVMPRATTGTGVLSVTVDAIADARVRAFSRSLPVDLPVDLVDTSRSVPITFEVEGARYLGSYTVLRDEDLKWALCVFAPESDVLGAAQKNQRTTMGIAALGTLLAVGFALWFGAAIARSLRKVVDETEQIGRFQLDQHPPSKSTIREVAQLSDAVEQMKRNLRSFQKYVPADVVRDLVATGTEASVGGRRQVLTIQFADIANFTSIAESTPPEELVQMLSECFELVTAPIVRTGGTVDKFIGDAVMAFWGAPRPDEQHALHACRAALENCDRLTRWNDEWQKKGRPRLEMRIGMHSGEVVVGNIGSGDRIGYTAIGDSVNLASRLEGLNRRYGTSILISGETWALVRDVMLARQVDRVLVKGRATAVEVYELLGVRAEQSPATLARVERHARAFSDYMAQRFEAAAEAFEALGREHPPDQATQLLAARCRAYAATPPGPEWDGTEHLTSKK